MSSESSLLPPSKKVKRLNDLRRRVPFVTKAALSEILKDVEEHGLPGAKSAKDMRKGAYKDLEQWSAYGAMFQSIGMADNEGLTMQVVIVNFLTLLFAACKVGGHFYECMMSALEVHGPTSIDNPFKLVLYSDECYPGNPLAAQASKKVWVTYASFANFGNQLLSMEDSWLPIFVQRTTFVQKLAGQMSQVIKHLLLSIFHGQLASPQSLGVLLEKPDGSKFRVYFDLGFFVQDGASQRECFSIKGDSGSKFCLKCSNQICILMPGEEDEENAVCKATKKADLVLASNQEVFASFDRLAARQSTCSSKDFKAWEQASGWTYTEHGIMACQPLRAYFLPVTMFMHDWMHAMCSSGAMNTAVYLILEAFQKHGLALWKSMHTFLKEWHLPRAFASCKLPDLFSPTRVESHRKAYKLKCQASDILSFYTICRYYVQSMGPRVSALEKECKAFVALSQVLDMLCSIGKQRIVGAELDAAVEAALSAFVDANWSDYMIKKFHWLLHLGDTLEEMKQLVPCWCLERKHKQVTAVATKVTNISYFEKTICAELLGEQLHRMARTPLPCIGLSQDCKAPKALLTFVEEHFGQNCMVYTANHVILQGGGKVYKQDVVLLASEDKWDCGHVKAPLKVNGQTFCLVQLYKLNSYDASKLLATWKNSEEMALVPLAEVLTAVTYTCLTDGVLTLIPFHLK